MGLGRPLADWMTRVFARLAKRSLGDRATPISESVTSDACYPYFYIHINFWRELLGLQQPPNVGAGSQPTCPCLFFWGAAAVAISSLPSQLCQLLAAV